MMSATQKQAAHSAASLIVPDGASRRGWGHTRPLGYIRPKTALAPLCAPSAPLSGSLPALAPLRDHVRRIQGGSAVPAKSNPASGRLTGSGGIWLLKLRRQLSRQGNYIPHGHKCKSIPARRIVLTFLPSGSMFPIAEAFTLASAAKKAVPGLSTCIILRRPEPRQYCAVFLFSQSIGLCLWVRAFGAASVGRFRKGGVDNLVRPARHFINMASRVHINLTEALL